MAALLAERPALAAAVRSRTSLEEFAAAHLKLLVGVRALVRLFGVGAETLTADGVRAWAEAAHPREGAEADLAASLVTIVSARAHVDCGFTGV